jgi:hypothetical protein
LKWESGGCETGAFIKNNGSQPATILVNGEHAKLLLHYCISKFRYIGNPAYLSMPKFLASCHHNEEEISWHLKKI